MDLQEIPETFGWNAWMHQILLVEDDVQLAKLVSEYLRMHEFVVEHEVNGTAAIPRILAKQPSAVLLDVNLPGQDGFSVCRTVRDQYGGAILMLTARTEDMDEITGLECGADDYLTKPVRPPVLLARLRSHLRMTEGRAVSGESGKDQSRVCLAGLEISPARREAFRDGSLLDLTAAEYDLLWFLVERAGRPVSRRELHEGLLGEPYSPRDRAIDLRVSRLRRKLGDSQERPVLLKAIHGVGYFLSSEQ